MLHRGDEAGAKAAYRAALAADPTHENACRNLGTVLRDRGDEAGAEAVFRAAVAAAPQSAWVHFNLGKFLWERWWGGERHERRVYPPVFAGAPDPRRRDQDDAEAALRAAIALEPQCARAHTLLGELLDHLVRDRAGAEAAFRAAVAADPQGTAARISLGKFLHEGEESYSAAEAVFRAAIALDPHCAEAHNCLGDLLLDWANDHDDGGDDDAADGAKRGFADDAKGAFCAAIEACKRRPQPKRHIVEALIGLAGIYEDSPHFADGARAVATYQAALKYDPENATAQEALDGLLNPAGDEAYGGEYGDDEDDEYGDDMTRW